MFAFDQKLYEDLMPTLKALRKRDKAFFMCMATLAKGSAGYCYATLSTIGGSLARYGYKPIKDRQSKEAFKFIKSLNVFDIKRSFYKGRLSTNHSKLNARGFHLYHMLSNRINDDFTQKPHLENTKTAPSEIPKPHHSDLDQIRSRNHPIKILPSTKVERCNYTNKDGFFSVRITEILDGMSADLRNKALFEYGEYEKNQKITSRDKVMEVIAKRIITNEKEYNHLAQLDRERSLRMQEQTRRIISLQDATPVYPPEERKAIIARARQQIRELAQ